MKRRAVLGSTASAVGMLSGCSREPAAEPSTGEIDVTFETRATRSYDVSLQLVDADGETVDEMESAFPPDQDGAPSFYAGGLTNGPYTVTIETDVDSTTFEWSVTNCRLMELDVTITKDGLVEYDSRCST